MARHRQEGGVDVGSSKVVVKVDARYFRPAEMDWVPVSLRYHCCIGRCRYRECPAKGRDIPKAACGGPGICTAAPRARERQAFQAERRECVSTVPANKHADERHHRIRCATCISPVDRCCIIYKTWYATTIRPKRTRRAWNILGASSLANGHALSLLRFSCGCYLLYCICGPSRWASKSFVFPTHSCVTFSDKSVGIQRLVTRWWFRHVSRYYKPGILLLRTSHRCQYLTQISGVIEVICQRVLLLAQSSTHT